MRGLCMSKRQLEDILELLLFHTGKMVEAKNRFQRESLNDYWIMNGIARTIQEIGELANEVPDDIRSRYAEIPWRKIINMRHVLVHHYENADNDVLWDVVELESERLNTQLQAVFAAELKRSGKE